MPKPYKILFLNQRAAKVFQDLARDLAERWSPSLIGTEVSDVVQFGSDENLQVLNAPRWTHYNRRNYFTRIVSYLAYYVYVFVKILSSSSRQTLLFFVTTPPFMGLIGCLFKKLRGQKYVMLVYDKYPDVLLATGVLKEGCIPRFWRKLNRVVLNHADAVITLGEYMADRLANDFDVSRTPLGHIAVIHNWADVELIKPLPKEHNPFIKEYGLEGKFIVMYSGNMGATHDMETLVRAAGQLKGHPDIRFVMIGDGARKQLVVDFKEKHDLDNMVILPYLPQDQLPYSLPSADIAVVSISSGIEGCLVPCKFYACLAAGSALLTICNPECEIADIVRNENCGKVIDLGDDEKLVESIVYYYENKDALQQARTNSRTAAVQKYSRNNTKQYIEVIEKILSDH